MGSASQGMLECGVLLFTRVKTADPDYHSEMNETVFLEWLNNMITSNLHPVGGKYASVFNRAKYHAMFT